jgi:tRNA-dihydrouridine synthase
MDFKNKLILAPMAGFTDHPMRHLAVRYGADMVVSEMISAKAMHF